MESEKCRTLNLAPRVPESEFKLRQYSQKLMARNHSLTFKIGQDSRYTFNTAAHRTKNAAQKFFIKFQYAQSYNSTSEVMENASGRDFSWSHWKCFIKGFRYNTRSSENFATRTCETRPCNQENAVWKIWCEGVLGYRSWINNVKGFSMKGTVYTPYVPRSVYLHLAETLRFRTQQDQVI